MSIIKCGRCGDDTEAVVVQGRPIKHCKKCRDIHNNKRSGLKRENLPIKGGGYNNEK